MQHQKSCFICCFHYIVSHLITISFTWWRMVCKGRHTLYSSLIVITFCIFCIHFFYFYLHFKLWKQVWLHIHQLEWETFQRLKQLFYGGRPDRTSLAHWDANAQNKCPTLYYRWMEKWKQYLVWLSSTWMDNSTACAAAKRRYVWTSYLRGHKNTFQVQSEVWADKL